MEKFQDLEYYLQKHLTPVFPDREFVNTLRKQLMGEVPLDMSGFELGPKHYAFAVITGILSVYLFTLAGLRAVVAIIGLVSIASQFLRNLSRRHRFTGT